MGNVSDGSAKVQADDTNSAISRLSSKNVSATVSGNASDGSAAGNIWNTVSAIGSLVGKTVTNFVNTVFTTTGKADGGIRPHADGGIRYHAHGAIANNPGAGVPLDIVGEAGAEAIVPLTNKKYSRPFAATIAEQMGEAAGNGAVVNAIAALAEAVRNMEAAVYVDGKKLASTIAKPMNQQLGRLAARGV